MAQSETGASDIEHTSGNLRTKLSALLARSRESLFVTLDRLRGNKQHVSYGDGYIRYEVTDMSFYYLADNLLVVSLSQCFNFLLSRF